MEKIQPQITTDGVDTAVRTASGELDRTEHRPPRWKKLAALLQEDTSGLHPRLIALNCLVGLLPRHSAPGARARLFSLAGFRVGEGTSLLSAPKINGGANLFSNLSIGRDCEIGADCVFDLGERVTIGSGVTLGPGVTLLTSTHELDIREHRAGAIQLKPVTIGDGAWLGAGVVILPGVVIGEGAVVDAGSVVNKDVGPQTRVGGTPAMPRGALPG
jgi:maltose O-acetyltransferase